MLIAFVIGVIPAMIASNKGHSFFLWYLYGVALFIVALPHALLLKPDKGELGRRALFGSTDRPCPHCTEVIPRVATVCRYCHRDVEPMKSAADY